MKLLPLAFIIVAGALSLATFATSQVLHSDLAGTQDGIVTALTMTTG